MNIGMVTTFVQSGHRILVTGATKCVCIFQQNCNQFCQSEYISCLIICSPCFFFGSCSVINLFDRWIWRLMNYCYTFRVNISINHSIRRNTVRFAENGFDKVVRAKKQKPLLRKQIHWKERKKIDFMFQLIIYRCRGHSISFSLICFLFPHTRNRTIEFRSQFSVLQLIKHYVNVWRSFILNLQQLFIIQRSKWIDWGGALTPKRNRNWRNDNQKNRRLDDNNQ